MRGHAQAADFFGLYAFVPYSIPNPVSNAKNRSKNAKYRRKTDSCKKFIRPPPSTGIQSRG